MLRAYECNVKGTDWQREIFAMSPGKAKSEYWRGVNESWNTIPYTAITCRCTGKPHNTLSFQRTAKYRGVPFATIGMNVTVDGEPGIIVGSNDSANFNVLFTGGKFKGQTLNCHPNWKMRYFNEDGTEKEQS